MRMYKTERMSRPFFYVSNPDGGNETSMIAIVRRRRQMTSCSSAIPWEEGMPEDIKNEISEQLTETVSTIREVTDADAGRITRLVHDGTKPEQLESELIGTITPERLEEVLKVLPDDVVSTLRTKIPNRRNAYAQKFRRIAKKYPDFDAQRLDRKTATEQVAALDALAEKADGNVPMLDAINRMRAISGNIATLEPYIVAVQVRPRHSTKANGEDDDAKKTTDIGVAGKPRQARKVSGKVAKEITTTKVKTAARTRQSKQSTDDDKGDSKKSVAKEKTTAAITETVTDKITNISNRIVDAERTISDNMTEFVTDKSDGESTMTEATYAMDNKDKVSPKKAEERPDTSHEKKHEGDTPQVTEQADDTKDVNVKSVVEVIGNVNDDDTSTSQKKPAKKSRARTTSNRTRKKANATETPDKAEGADKNQKPSDSEKPTGKKASRKATKKAKSDANDDDNKKASSTKPESAKAETTEKVVPTVSEEMADTICDNGHEPGRLIGVMHAGSRKIEKIMADGKTADVTDKDQSDEKSTTPKKQDAKSHREVMKSDAEGIQKRHVDSGVAISPVADVHIAIPHDDPMIQTTVSHAKDEPKLDTADDIISEIEEVTRSLDDEINANDEYKNVVIASDDDTYGIDDFEGIENMSDDTDDDGAIGNEESTVDDSDLSDTYELDDDNESFEDEAVMDSVNDVPNVPDESDDGMLTTEIAYDDVEYDGVTDKEDVITYEQHDVMSDDTEEPSEGTEEIADTSEYDGDTEERRRRSDSEPQSPHEMSSKASVMGPDEVFAEPIGRITQTNEPITANASSDDDAMRNIASELKVTDAVSKERLTRHTGHRQKHGTWDLDALNRPHRIAISKLGFDGSDVTSHVAEHIVTEQPGIETQVEPQPIQSPSHAEPIDTVPPVRRMPSVSDGDSMDTQLKNPQMVYAMNGTTRSDENDNLSDDAPVRKVSFARFKSAFAAIVHAINGNRNGKDENGKQ